jgi:mono/diheme cytochrome c family protein
MTRSTLALVALVAFPVAIGAQAGNPSPAAPARGPATGNATAGKTLYYDHACYACHGYGGETGARAFVGNRSPVLANEDAFLRFLRARNTISPPVSSTSMPSYAASTLSDRQAKDIYAYVRSFTSHAPPLEQIETLTQILKAASQPR